MTTTIRIQFNGSEKELPSGTTILTLLESAGVKSRFCAVERNGEIVAKVDYATLQVDEGDCLEVVTLVGGG